jgi:hypothetical protein
MKASMRASPPCQERRSRSPFHSFERMKSAARVAFTAHPGSPNARDARARPRIISPFHPASTLSSSPGLTRFSRASKSRRRAWSRSARTDASSRPSSRASASTDNRACRTVRPCSKFPADEIPNQRRASSASGGGSTASTSAGVQTKNLPSSPSLSASCVA